MVGADFEVLAVMGFENFDRRMRRREGFCTVRGSESLGVMGLASMFGVLERGVLVGWKRSVA